MWSLLCAQAYRTADGTRARWADTISHRPQAAENRVLKRPTMCTHGDSNAWMSKMGSLSFGTGLRTGIGRASDSVLQNVRKRGLANPPFSIEISLSLHQKVAT